MLTTARMPPCLENSAWISSSSISFDERLFGVLQLFGHAGPHRRDFGGAGGGGRGVAKRKLRGQMIQVSLQIDHGVVRGNGMALQRMGDLPGPLRRQLEQPQPAVLQERPGNFGGRAARPLRLGSDATRGCITACVSRASRPRASPSSIDEAP